MAAAAAKPPNAPHSKRLGHRGALPGEARWLNDLLEARRKQCDAEWTDDVIPFTGGEELSRQQHCRLQDRGQHPRRPLLKRLGCAFGDDGGVRCSETGETSIPGVFVAGDVSRDVQLAIIAEAEGARAALAINKQLLEADDRL